MIPFVYPHFTMHKKNILLVEDELIIAESEKMKLQKYGYNVFIVNSGRKAIDIVTNKSDIDLILMDINLGSDMDGTETARIILGFVDIPIIFYSSYTSSDIVQKTDNITFYGYITKNTNITVLDATIKMAFKLFESKNKNKVYDKKYNRIVEGLKDEYFFYSHDTDGIFKYVSSSVKSILGYAPDEFMKHYATFFTDSIINQDCITYTNNCLQGIIQPSYNIEVLHKNGTFKYLKIKEYPIYDSNNNVVSVDGIAQDVTEFIKIQQQLSFSEEKHRLIISMLPEIIWQLDNNGKLIYASDSSYKIFGYDYKDVLNKSFTDFFLNEEIPKAKEIFFNAMNGIKHQVVELNGLKKNGKIFPLEICVIPIVVDKKVIGVQGIARDITERRNSEYALKESEEKFKKIFQNVNGGIFVADADTGMLLDANANAVILTGYSLEKLKSMHQSDLHPPDLREDAKKLFEKHSKINANRIEHWIQTADGIVIPVIIRATGSFKHQGKNLHVGIFYDNTERKKSENKIKTLLNEKQMLLQETHHRIKNNMSILRSIFEIESDMHDKHPDCKKILQDSSSRVMSMMTLYDYLYKTEIENEMSVQLYLYQLVEKIKVIHKHFPIKIETHFDDIYLKSSIMSKIGIIINELFTNSFKYAFNNKYDCNIFISLKKYDNIITLIFSDNGIGLPSTFSFENSNSFGMRLIKMLVSENKGKVEAENQSLGSKFIINIPV